MVSWNIGVKKWLLLAGLLVSMGAQADPKAVINTDPSKLIGKPILFFKLDHTDVKLLEPACVVPLTNWGRGGQWFDMVRGHPILDDPRYGILKGADSLHHYCRGKAAEIRYFKERDPVMKKRLLEEMVGEYVFMIGHPQYLPKNWPYMKVMHLELGKARMLEKNPAQAIRSFEQALSLDPAYDKAHIAYSDALTDMGQKAKALLQVTEGLRHNPDSRAIQRRYEELGGKSPFPEPYKKAEPEIGKAAAEVPVADADKASDAVPAVIQAEPAPEPTTPPATAVPPAGASEKGNNPYCRFCPASAPETATPPATAAPTGASEKGNTPYCRFCP